MNAYIRYCIKCGEAFDIGINNDECPKCRREQEVEKDGGEERIP